MYRHVWKFILVVFLIGGTALILAAQADDSDDFEPEYDDCTELRTLMADRERPTPYDYAIGGFPLNFGEEPQMVVQGTLTADDWANYYAFQVTGTNGTLTVTFDEIETGLVLEYGLFRGVLPNDEAGFLLTSENAEHPFTLAEAGTYTLVIRRPHVTDEDNVGSYRLTAAVEDTETTDIGELGSYQDAAAARQIETEQNGSQQIVRFRNGAEAYIPLPLHTYTITDRLGNSRINFTPGDSRTFVQLPVQSEIHYTGGGLGAKWEGAEGSLTLYIESMDYTSSLDNLAVVALGGILNTRFNELASVYILDSCVGFELRAVGGRGNTFVAPIDPGLDPAFSINQPRVVQPTDCTTTTDVFDIVLNAPDGDGGTSEHTICLSWDGIQPQTEVRLEDGIFTAELVGGRTVEIQSQTIHEFSRAREGSTTDLEAGTNIPLTLRFDEPETEVENEEPNQITVTLNWVNLTAFRYSAPEDDSDSDAVYCARTSTETVEGSTENTTGDDPHLRCMIFTFSDDDPERDRMARPGNGVENVTALNDEIHIVYTDGAERLILPASETYIELVTPSTDAFDEQVFDAAFVPGEEGFVPLDSNNLGGECYLFPTLHPEANCAPNGYPNPANGNLWYGIVDHSAAGFLLNLELVRSYNSGDAAIDGPFGLGWSSNFLLDYNVAFDEEADARIITTKEIGTYRVGLDLIWQPHGRITFTTPTGSRILFSGSGNRFASSTMPGWVLVEQDTGWVLFQDSGLYISFDRAGRMTSYGYADESRVFSITYIASLANRLDGPAGYGDGRAVIVSDDRSQRQLELYYDDTGHIYRSVLRDVTEIPDYGIACELADNCLETLYRYEEVTREDADSQWLLQQVIYPNRQTAIYSYNGENRLECHVDPRAPISPQMRYTYDDRGRVTQVRVNQTAAVEGYCDQSTAEGEQPVWRTLQYFDDRGGRVDVTDELGFVQTYRYDVQGGDIDKEASYRLASIGSQEYAWQSYPGVTDTELRDSVIESVTNDNRNVTVTYTYVRDGIHDRFAVQKIDTGTAIYSVNQFDIQKNHIPIAPDTVTLGDGRVVRYLYAQPQTIFTFFVQQIDIDNIAYVSERDSDTNWVNRIRRFDRFGGGYEAISNAVYEYNPVGLVTSYFFYFDGTDYGYRVRYTYDGLGQLRLMRDSIGLYRVENNVLPCGDTGDACHEIIVTDPHDAVTIYRYDGREQLIETQLREGENGDLLRRTRYQYDAFGRLTGEIQYAADVECEFPEPNAIAGVLSENTDENCLITTYDYTPDQETNQLAITRTNAEGRTSIQVFDAQGRLIQTTDETEHVTDYAYEGGNVVQTDHYGDAERETTYTRDEAGRISEVSVSPDSPFVPGFRLTYGSPNGMQLRNGNTSSTIWTTRATWTWHTSRIGTLSIPELSWDPQQNQPQPLAFELDYTGVGDVSRLVTTLPDDVRHNTQATYCPEDEGGYRIIYHRRGGAQSLPTACSVDTAEVDAIYSYDAYDRLMQVVDEFGTREFTYEQDTVRDYRWRVTMTATSGEAAYTWVMIYNYAGDLLEWTDDNGFTRTYTYDLIGRMTSVSTNDSTDAAFIDVTYNRIGQVTTIENGRGYSTQYEYEDTGRLQRQIERFGEHDLSSTIYQYSESGLLESVVVCQGDVVECPNTDVEKIEYGYDTNDPTLLTSVTINDVEHQFSWEGANIRDNQLRYTNPLDNDTVYRFNVLGQLMQATDAEGNAYEWTYNNFGYLAGYEPPDLPLLIESDDSSQQTQSSRFTPQYQLAYNPIFDADNDIRFFAVGDSALAWRRTIQRTPMGLPLSFENPGVLRFGYDALARLSSVSSYAQSGSLETGWQMVQRDGQNSMQFSIAGVETLPSYTLLFDPLNRLVGLGDETATQDYDFSSPPGSEETITIPGEGYTITENSVTVARSGEEWRYSYDVLGRLQQVEFARCEQGDDPGCPGESDTRITYDAAGNVTEMVHEDGRVECFEYNPVGNLKTYIPDASDECDESDEDNIYTYHYDGANRLIAIDSPDGKRMTYFYVGERIAGMCVSLDPEGDPQGECADDSIIERYSYDALGRITARQFLTYAGPSMGDVVNDFRTDIEDNTAGNMYETSPQTLYTPLGQLATVGNGAALDYDDDGLGLLTTYDTGDTTYSFNYEPNLRFDPARPMLLTGITNSEVPFANYTYTYDAWGRVKEFTVNGRSFQYAYEVNDFSVSDGSSSVRVPYTGVVVEPSTRREVDDSQDTSSDRCEVDDSQDTSSDRCIMRDSSFTVERRFTTEAWTNFEHPGLPLVSQIITITDVERVSDPREEAGEDPWRNFNSGEPIEYNKHRYFYDYDEVGNLTGIVYFGPYSVYPVNDADAVFVPIQCAAFTYDNANRLMSAQVRQPAGTIDWADLDQHGLDWLSDQPAFRQRALLTDENAVAYHYQYDAYDRLVQAGDYSFIYVNDSLVPSFAYEGDRLVTAAPSANADGWVFDDTGWLVPEGGFEGDTENPCSLGLPTEQPEFEMGTVLFDGMLVDPASGLYFYGGRAYLPSIGRFLQRDPLGPDVAGNVYGYPTRAVEIPMPEQRSTIGDGLHVLSYAMMWYPERQMLTADTILKQNLPHIEPTLNGFSRTLLQQQRNADGMIRSYLEMPVRIRDSFNQPSPEIDLASGLVSWQPNMVPWQAAPNGESLFANEFWENEIALNSPILTPDAMFSRLNTLTTVGYRPPTTAAPQGWNQSQTVSIPGNDLPVSPFVQSPDAVLNPLLPSWTDPTSSLYVLDVTEGMRQQPYQTGLLWAQEALEMQLPAIYILPIVPNLYKPDVQFSPTHVTP